MAKTIVKISFVFFVLSFNLFAQQDTSKTNSGKAFNQDTTVFKMQKSPWGAVLRGAIIPGWGQIYNRSYWKAPIVWGLLGFYAYYWKVNNDKYTEYRRLAVQYKLDPNRGPSAISIRNSYRDQRDLVSLYMGLTYFLSLVDAYVDAQLFDFTVEQNPYTQAPQLNLRIHF